MVGIDREMERLDVASKALTYLLLMKKIQHQAKRTGEKQKMLMMENRREDQLFLHISELEECLGISRQCGNQASAAASFLACS